MRIALIKGSVTDLSLDDVPVSWADTFSIQLRKIATREAYTTDIGPFGRRCVLAYLVAVL